MTVADAAKVFETEKRRRAKAEPQFDAAKEVLKAHFRKSGRKTYKDTIAYGTQKRRVLDQGALKDELGERFDSFKKPTTVETLTLL